MRHRGVRVGLLLLFLVILIAATYRTFLLERNLAADATEGRDAEALTWTINVGLTELRAAQQAYVAVGQGEAYWAGRVSARLATLREQLEQLAASAVAPDAVSAVRAAESTLQSFGQMDARARDYVVSGQRLMASDLIFTDGVELTAAAGSHIEAARRHEQVDRDARSQSARLEQAGMAAGVAFAGLVVAVLLLPIPPTRGAPASAASEKTVRVAAASDADVLAGASLRPEAMNGTPALATPPRHDARALESAAELCTDLARVNDARDVPVLLERAARLLDASGLVVWVAGAGGSDLRAALSHGYPAAVLARLGTIGRDDDNATAAAFRNARAEVVPGDGRVGGALILPLLTPTGCAGALTIELRNGAESEPSTRALAAIVAAQVATLTAPPGATPAAEEPLRATGRV